MAEETKLDQWLKDILTEKWKDMNMAHPSTMTAREPTALTNCHNNKILDVLNNFHAYCVPCRKHIYSRSDPSDEYSWFVVHTNDARHRLKMALFPQHRPVGTVQEPSGGKKWICNACEEEIYPQNHSEKTPLKTLITKHVTSVQHKYNAFCMEDNKMSFLISLSLNSKLRSMTSYKTNLKGFCKLCEKDIWEVDEKHLRTQAHLQNVGKFLESQLDFNMADVNDDKKIRVMLVKLSSFRGENKKLDLVLSEEDYSQDVFPVETQLFLCQKMKSSDSKSDIASIIKESPNDFNGFTRKMKLNEASGGRKPVLKPIPCMGTESVPQNIHQASLIQNESNSSFSNNGNLLEACNTAKDKESPKHVQYQIEGKRLADPLFLGKIEEKNIEKETGAVEEKFQGCFIGPSTSRATFRGLQTILTQEKTLVMEKEEPESSEHFDPETLFKKRKKKISEMLKKGSDHIYLDDEKQIVLLSQGSRAFCMICKKKIEEPKQQQEESPGTKSNDKSRDEGQSFEKQLANHISAINHKFKLYRRKDPSCSLLKQLESEPAVRSLTTSNLPSTYKCYLCDTTDPLTQHFGTKKHLKNFCQFFYRTFNQDILDYELIQNKNQILEQVVAYNLRHMSWHGERNEQVVTVPPEERLTRKRLAPEKLVLASGVGQNPIDPQKQLVGKLGSTDKNISWDGTQSTLRASDEKLMTLMGITQIEQEFGERSGCRQACEQEPHLIFSSNARNIPKLYNTFKTPVNDKKKSAGNQSQRRKEEILAPSSKWSKQTQEGHSENELEDSYAATTESLRQFFYGPSTRTTSFSAMAAYGGPLMPQTDMENVAALESLESLYRRLSKDRKKLFKQLKKRRDHVYLDDDKKIIQIGSVTLCLLCNEEIREWKGERGETSERNDGEEVSNRSPDLPKLVANHTNSFKHKVNSYGIQKKGSGYDQLISLEKEPIVRTLTTSTCDAGLVCIVCGISGRPLGKHFTASKHLKNVCEFLSSLLRVEVLDCKNNNEILELVAAYKLGCSLLSGGNGKKEEILPLDLNSEEEVDKTSLKNRDELEVIEENNGTFRKNLAVKPDEVPAVKIDCPLGASENGTHFISKIIFQENAIKIGASSSNRKIKPGPVGTNIVRKNWSGGQNSSQTLSGGNQQEKTEGESKLKNNLKVLKFEFRILPERKDIKKFHCESCNTQGAVPNLLEHIVACLAPNGLNDIHTDTCHSCHLFIIWREQSLHFESLEHQSTLEKVEKRRENMKEKKSQEQLKELIEMKVLRVEGIPDVSDKLSLMYNVFKEFGPVDCVKVTGTSAIIQFWLQESVGKVLKQDRFLILGRPVTLKEGILDVVAEPRSVGLAEEIVTLLMEPNSLLHHCYDLADNALDLMNNPIERDREQQLLFALETVVTKFRRGRPHHRWLFLPFGSRFTGLTLSSVSDIDVFTGSEATLLGNSQQHDGEQREIVHRVQGWLSQSQDFRQIEAIARARVPIIRFLHVPTGLQCDLSFRNGLSVRNSQLVRYLLSLDNRVRPMVLFLKEWTNRNGFKLILTSYAMSMLVFVYLAQLDVPVLPTMSQLRPKYVRPYFIAGWDTSFSENLTWKSQNKASVVELIMDFFHFFAKFRYDEFIIYPMAATFIQRKHLLEIEKQGDLPAEVRSNLDYIPWEGFSSEIDFCIMDPFDLSHNLTKRIRNRAFLALVELFDRSFRLLSESLRPKSSSHC